MAKSKFNFYKDTQTVCTGNNTSIYADVDYKKLADKLLAMFKTIESISITIHISRVETDYIAITLFHNNTNGTLIISEHSEMVFNFKNICAKIEFELKKTEKCKS